MKRTNRYLEQLQKRREAATGTVSTPPVETTREAELTENMTDEQLDAAISRAKRELLDAQHAQLREDLAGEASAGAEGRSEAAIPTSLAAVLGDLKRASRRRRRRTS